MSSHRDRRESQEERANKRQKTDEDTQTPAHIGLEIEALEHYLPTVSAAVEEAGVKTVKSISKEFDDLYEEFVTSRVKSRHTQAEDSLNLKFDEIRNAIHAHVIAVLPDEASSTKDFERAITKVIARIHKNILAQLLPLRTEISTTKRQEFRDAIVKLIEADFAAHSTDVLLMQQQFHHKRLGYNKAALSNTLPHTGTIAPGVRDVTVSKVASASVSGESLEAEVLRLRGEVFDWKSTFDTMMTGGMLQKLAKAGVNSGLPPTDLNGFMTYLQQGSAVILLKERNEKIDKETPRHAVWLADVRRSGHKFLRGGIQGDIVQVVTELHIRVVIECMRRADPDSTRCEVCKDVTKVNEYCATWREGREGCQEVYALERPRLLDSLLATGKIPKLIEARGGVSAVLRTERDLVMRLLPQHPWYQSHNFGTRDSFLAEIVCFYNKKFAFLVHEVMSRRPGRHQPREFNSGSVLPLGATSHTVNRGFEVGGNDYEVLDTESVKIWEEIMKG